MTAINWSFRDDGFGFGFLVEMVVLTGQSVLLAGMQNSN